jgi:hypothetical protein
LGSRQLWSVFCSNFLPRAWTILNSGTFVEYVQTRAGDSWMLSGLQVIRVIACYCPL